MVGLFYKCFENYIVGEEIGGCQSLRMGSEEEYGESYIEIEEGRSLWWWNSSISWLWCWLHKSKYVIYTTKYTCVCMYRTTDM